MWGREKGVAARCPLPALAIAGFARVWSEGGMLEGGPCQPRLQSLGGRKGLSAK